LNPSDKNNNKKQLYICNPNKFISCQYLVEMHEKRGDKIIVFSDDIFALKWLARYLERPYISGEVSQQERLNVLEYFKQTSEVNTILLSKVGDTSIDLPIANVII